jgi:hypothetical protein
MAQVKPVPGSTDWQLDWSLWQWGRLPEVEAEIDQWDQLDQIHFIEEWPLEEERLLQLEQDAVNGHLTPEQLRRYEQLQCLVAQNRPIIQRLRAS